MASVPNSQESDPLMNIFGSGRLSSGSQGSNNACKREKTQKKTKEPVGTQISQLRKTRNMNSKYALAKNTETGMCDERGVTQVTKNPVEEQARDASQDLFRSQSSSRHSLVNEQIDITLQLSENIWVQCDNPDCQKWRRIPATASSNLDNAAWYCHMNPDPNCHSCAAPEEDHAMYDRMARKAGIKFVMSMLNEGSLVWAKMSGYCKWPAIITRDPACGIHVFIDLDGDPHSYHVEFLGNPHSHSWVAAKFVSVFGHKDLPEIDDSQSQTRDSDAAKPRRGGRRERGRGRGVTRSRSAPQGRQRKSYHRIHIEDVIEEADFLLEFAAEERLRHCTFTYYPSKKNKDLVLCDEKQSKSCDQCGQNSVQKRKRKQNNPSKHPSRHQKKSTVITMRHRLSSPVISLPKGHGSCKKPKGKENRPTVYDYSSDVSEISQDEGISVPTIKTEGSQMGFESPEQFSQSKLQFTNTLVGKTKEEKYRMDLDMYKKNERAFEHDVYRFMLRHGRKIRSVSIWHNVPVRLFQVFLAVHERGGFDQVTRQKQWTAVFKELTEQQSVTNGVPAKKFYQRNLYPYELYMTGKDFHDCFNNKKSSSVSKPSVGAGLKSDTQVRSTRSVSGTPGVREEGAGAESEELASWEKPQGGSLSQDIADLLGELKDDGVNTVGQNADKNADGLSSGLKYQDQSTPSESHGRVPSEFHPSSLTGFSSENQEVPDVGEGESGGDLADIEDKILHEMRALEEDMKRITGDF